MEERLIHSRIVDLFLEDEIGKEGLEIIDRLEKPGSVAFWAGVRSVKERGASDVLDSLVDFGKAILASEKSGEGSPI